MWCDLSNSAGKKMPHKNHKLIKHQTSEDTQTPKLTRKKNKQWLCAEALSTESRICISYSHERTWNEWKYFAIDRKTAIILSIFRRMDDDLTSICVLYQIRPEIIRHENKIYWNNLNRTRELDCGLFIAVQSIFLSIWFDWVWHLLVLYRQIGM